MSETIALTTPTQINAWVLLSRRSQLHMHMGIRPDGTPAKVKMPVKGIVAWCKANLGPECTTAARSLLRLNELMSEHGLKSDPWQHVLVAVKSKAGSSYASDYGVWANMDAVEANADIVRLYGEGRVELVFTNDKVRDANPALIYQFG